MKKLPFLFLSIVLCLVLIACSSEAYARGGGHGGGHGGGRGCGWGGRGWGGYPYWGWGGDPYWYWGSAGYASGFFVGSAIATQPAGYQTVVAGGVPYYYANGYYYQQDCY